MANQRKLYGWLGGILNQTDQSHLVSYRNALPIRRIRAAARGANKHSMQNIDFQKFQYLKEELAFMQELCPNQYFTNNKCKGRCGRMHVERSAYPCIFFYQGHCKHGHKCHFRHAIKVKINRPEPASNICRTYFQYGTCNYRNQCRYSHNLREEPCIWNSLDGCKFTAVQCRFSHELKAEIILPCFFYLMKGCNKDPCSHSHSIDIIRNFTYHGPVSP